MNLPEQVTMASRTTRLITDTSAAEDCRCTPPPVPAACRETDSRLNQQQLHCHLWGQFLRGDGTLYRPHTEPFVDAIEAATTTAELFNAFPLRRLDIVGPVHEVTEWLATNADARQIDARSDRRR